MYHRLRQPLLLLLLLLLPPALSVLAAPPFTHHATLDKRFSSCTDISAPSTFTITDINYVKHLVYYAPGSPLAHNTTQFVFGVANQANGVSTGCSYTYVRLEGEWTDPHGTYLFSCYDRSIVIGERETPVLTSSTFDWDTWHLAVNQTWACDEQASVQHLTTTNLAPNCTAYETAYEYVESCLAPEVEAVAVLQ
ncbi:hypothetical protein F4778DRAFT_562291 [Xylariomycetidae sp. FL2044]|nr:hypothetical protein F4778DRAFT_562291 [Xylariomycetidae sp. FL2044]